MNTQRTALITGGAKRIGAEIARQLHRLDFNVVIHCGQSVVSADKLCAELNAMREQSAIRLQADLNDLESINHLAERTVGWNDGLDILVNNASSFFPTPLGHCTETEWDALLGVNLKAPFFLCQKVVPALRKSQGAIVNLIDIYAERPLAAHAAYCAAKAGLASLTRSFAVELAPDVRVNGVSPGAILWPDQEPDSSSGVLTRVPFGRLGSPGDIARTVAFLATGPDYISGQIIAVDGARSVNP